MSSIVPQLVQITCPACNTGFRSQIYSLVDAEQTPELKQMLLAGTLNVAQCSNCGMTTLIALPIMYHDASKQICFVYIPQELNISTDEQERLIGESTSAIIQMLPPDAPRAYLLTPNRFMSVTSLIDAILEADGIPREVVEQQRNRIDLISRLAEALQDEAQFNRIAEQHKDEINLEFFAMLNAFIEASDQQGQDETVQMLKLMLNKLVKLTGFDGDVPHQEIPLEKVFEQLEQATEEELPEIIAEVRPAIDYSFFQKWTERIEELEKSGKKQEAQTHYQRRTLVLDTVEKMDKEAQALFEAGSDLLREVVNVSDPKAVLKEKSHMLNEAFMLVLSANVDAARRAGQEDIAERLEEISYMAIEIIQESLPPEERLINDILLAESPQEASQALRGQSSLVTTDFVKKLNELAEEQEKRGLKDNATRLRQAAREASAMLF